MVNFINPNENCIHKVSISLCLLGFSPQRMKTQQLFQKRVSPRNKDLMIWEHDKKIQSVKSINLLASKSSQTKMLLLIEAAPRLCKLRDIHSYVPMVWVLLHQIRIKAPLIHASRLLKLKVQPLFSKIKMFVHQKKRKTRETKIHKGKLDQSVEFNKHLKPKRRNQRVYNLL